MLLSPKIAKRLYAPIFTQTYVFVPLRRCDDATVRALEVLVKSYLSFGNVMIAIVGGGDDIG